MNFEKMLEYQLYDQELYNRQAALLASPEGKAKEAADKAFNDAKAAFVKLNNEARDLLGSYSALKAELDENKDELDGFDGILDDVSDPAEMEQYLKRAMAIKGKLDALEKKVNDVINKIEKVNENSKSIRAQGMTAEKNKKNAENAFRQLCMSYQTELDDLRKKMEAIKDAIPEDMAEYFKARKSVKKFPVMKSFDVKNKFCPGCGMELAGDTIAKLKNPGDFSECPNCHKLLYVPTQQ